MKKLLQGMGTYTTIMLLISAVSSFVGAILMIIFGSENGKTIGDLLHWLWVEFYFTGSLLGSEAYHWHIAGLIFAAIINYLDEKA